MIKALLNRRKKNPRTLPLVSLATAAATDPDKDLEPGIWTRRSPPTNSLELMHSTVNGRDREWGPKLVPSSGVTFTAHQAPDAQPHFRSIRRLFHAARL